MSKLKCDGCGEEKVTVAMYIEHIDSNGGILAFFKNVWYSINCQLFSKRYFYCIECLTELETELDASKNEVKSETPRKP